MAEVVGLVAASIELGRAVLELKKTFQEVREAPKEISGLIKECERLSGLLALTLKRQNDFLPQVQPEQEICEIQDSCRAAVDELLAFCNTINLQLQKGRWRGSLKAATKKHELLDHQMRLDRAKSSLQLAQSAHNTMMLHQLMLQNTSTQTLLTAASVVQPPEPTNSAAACVSDCCSPSSSDVLAVGNRLNSNNKRVRKQRRNYGFRLPVRWLSWALHVKATQCFNGWTIELRTWNYVPYDSPIFQYSMNGDVYALKRLLDSKEASVRDLTTNGWSALHYAVICRQMATAQLLIEYGSDVNLRNEYNDTAFASFVLFTPISSVLEDDDEIDRCHILRQDGHLEPFVSLMETAGAEDFIGDIQFMPKLLRYFADTRHRKNQQLLIKSTLSRVWPPYRERPLAERIRVACEALMLSPFCFLDLLGQPFDQVCVEAARHIMYDCWLWDKIVQGFGQCMRECCCDTRIEPQEHERLEVIRGEFVAGWREILRQYIDMENAEIFAANFILESILLFAASTVCSSRPPINAEIAKMMQFWVDELRESGVSTANLRLLTDHEVPRFIQSSAGIEHIPCFSFVVHNLGDCPRRWLELIDFETGVDPESWSATFIWTTVRTDDEFSDDLSNQVPGAWPDGDGDSYQYNPSTTSSIDSEERTGPEHMYEIDSNASEASEIIGEDAANATSDEDPSADTISNLASND